MKKIFLALVALGFACSSSSSDDGGSEDNFDRGALLVNLADNIIVPAFENLSTQLLTLKTRKDAFLATPNQTNLNALRTSYVSAYTSWQSVEMYNIGEAEAILYGFQMNVYPTNIVDIEANITAGSYDLSNVNNNDAVGFPAVDYLLYGVANGDEAILEKYENSNYLNYLSDLINQMVSLTDTVLTNWKASYLPIFTSSTGNTATSALNKFTNDFVFYYEKGLRANKFGIPSGVFSTDALPEKVEGFYSDVNSKDLALEALNAVEEVFNGTHFSSTATGDSFATYLNDLGRDDLVTKVNSQIGAAREKIEVLDDSFYNQVITDNTKMTEAYDALQLVVVSLKVDMLQAFNINVDYVDADGD